MLGDGGVSATAPLGLLLSSAVEAQHGERIAALARNAGVALRRCTIPRAPRDLEQVHAAFFSRELYEGSTLRTPGLAAREFFARVDAAPNLRWLHVCSSGLDLPMYQPALARGVRVTPATGSTALPIAQSVIAAMLAQSRGFDHWLAAQREHAWRPFGWTEQPREITGQRVAVVGAGPIAREIARLAKAVDFHPIAVRRQAEATPPFLETVTVAGLDALLPTCDWLVLACPLTDETRGLVDARRLALLPPHARLANVSRGEVVDEAALVEALRARRLAGAYLDVLEHEPLPAASPLWDLPGVWITPHNCAAAQGHEQRVVDTFLARLGPWLREQPAAAPQPLETTQ